jgi:uncharacterized protein
MVKSALSKFMFPSIPVGKLWAHVAIPSLAIVISFSAAAAPEPIKSGGGKHCLWRVTNAKAPFYLLGTVHSLPPHNWKFPPVTENAIRESHQFWFEIDPNRGDLFSKKLNAAARYPKGTKVKDKIDPKTYATLVQITQSGAARMWENLRPWAIAMLMFDPRYGSFARKYGADNHVLEEAKWRRCPVGGIETMDEHIRVFSGMTDSEGEMYLLQTIIYSNEDAKNIPTRLAAWQNGDCETIYSEFLPRMKEAPSVWWRIIDHRNAMWIPRIETEIRTGIPTMIVAGALHFCGPHSVIALLEKRGYKIEQL